MARVAFATRAIDEAGNAIGGSGTEVRVYDDFGASVASVVTADSAGATTITQPITPNAGTQTTLTVTTLTTDTTLTVASTTGFAVGQFVPIYDGTNTKYRFITAILAGPARLTIDSAIGIAFSNTNTSIGNPDMIGVVAGYVLDTTFHYVQTKDVGSTRVMPPTLIPTFIGIQSLAVLEEGAAAGTRPTMNFIGPLITAVDNVPSSRVDVTVATPTAPTASAVGDAQVTGSTATVASAGHVHAREAFATPVAIAFSNASGSATTIPRSDHVHAGPHIEAKATAGSAQSESVTWTTAFGSAPIVSCSLVAIGANPQGIPAITSTSTTGATVTEFTSVGGAPGNNVKHVIAMVAT